MRRSDHHKPFLERLTSLFKFIRKPAAQTEVRFRPIASPDANDDLKDFSRNAMADGMQVLEIEQTEFVLEWERVIATAELVQGKEAPPKKVDRRLPQFDRRIGQGDRRGEDRRNGNETGPAHTRAHPAENWSEVGFQSVLSQPAANKAKRRVP